MRFGRFLAFLLLLVGAGGALWWVKYKPTLPQFSQAQVNLAPDSWKDTVHSLDSQVAEGIRAGASGKWQLPTIIDSESLQSFTKATVSASVSTSPEQFWNQLRQDGAQAALSSVAQSLEVKTGQISTDVVNEARYQYCLGVVQAHGK